MTRGIRSIKKALKNV